MIERVTPSPPLSPVQYACVALLARGHNARDIGERLGGISWRTVKFHLHQAAKRIPGDLPAQMRIVFWYRGASREQLDGTILRRDGDTSTKVDPKARGQSTSSRPSS